MQLNNDSDLEEHFLLEQHDLVKSCFVCNRTLNGLVFSEGFVSAVRFVIRNMPNIASVRLKISELKFMVSFITSWDLHLNCQ
ncbi:hypothetical protein CWI39_0344p0010 [Hamiltosporidium magnivora]|uniref:Uncharacterized protein n=1 Tax=Hamiltosporidium magnivora TaxID=148818 RepID=A0A4Q9LH31_9MICR|nr:hypothetical protein CWI39_0344p0010 [Hamiltosporidium magnivora]